MSIENLTNRLRTEIGDYSFKSVVEWKSAHPDRRAIGLFPVYAPVELVHAAGMFPVTIAGASGGVKIDRANEYLQAFVCSIGRSTLELELSGALKVLDGMVFPSVCEIARGLSGVWNRLVTDKPVLYLHFPQNVISPGAVDYLEAELNRLKSSLEEIGGTEITSEALNESFRVINRRTELVRKLDQYRQDCPWSLKASEFYLLKLAGLRIPVEEHIGILEEAVEITGTTEPHRAPGFRVILTGAFCELPPLEMLEVIENERVAIVSDDILPGFQWWKSPLPESENPVRTLAEHYIGNISHGSIMLEDPGNRCEDTIARIKDARAYGVIYASPKFCQPSLHDAACLIRTCEEKGIPYVRLEYEEEMTVFESIRVQIEAIREAREALPYAGTDSVDRAGRESNGTT